VFAATLFLIGWVSLPPELGLLFNIVVVFGFRLPGLTFLLVGWVSQPLELELLVNTAVFVVIDDALEKNPAMVGCFPI
jgi:hypothetical protein